MKRYLIRKVTDYFGDEKPERMGKIVTLVIEPEIGHPALFLYENSTHIGFRTSNVVDIHWMLTISTGESEMVLETENSNYFLLEVGDVKEEEN